MDIDQLLCLPEPLMPANGFSCKEAHEAVFVGGAAQDFHREHLVIGGQVRVFEDGSDLVLAGGDFVVARLDRDRQLEHFRLGIGHAGQHALGNRAEVLIFEFLALGGLGAEKGAAGS